MTMTAERLIKEEGTVRGGRMTGAHAIWRQLMAEGVNTTFGYIGGANIPTFIAYNDYRRWIKNYMPLHEQGGIHAAEGYARMTRHPGVVLATSGPGALNLITGLADAQRDSTPIVALTGQVATSALGKESFQESDMMKATNGITKWSYLVRDPKELPEVIREAFYRAREGRPGPVLVDIPKDVQLKDANFPEFRPDERPTKPQITSKERGQFAKAAALINGAEKPMVIVGQGALISGATSELMEIASRSQILVANTLLGKSAFPENHPLSLGMLGMHGHFAGNVLTGETDLVLVAGARLDDRLYGDASKFLHNAKIIHIDIDPSRFDMVARTEVKPAELAICADVKPALEAILGGLEKREHPRWVERFKEMAEFEFDELTIKRLYPTSGELSQSETIRMLTEKTRGKAVVVADVGQHQMFAALDYPTTHPNSFVTSGGLGTMGFALPAGIGVKIASPERDVVVICGDGSFQMTMQELGMLKKYKIPIAIMIQENRFLGMVRQWEELFDDDQSEVELDNPVFEQIASAYGISAERVKYRDQLEPAMERMLSAIRSDRPYLLALEVENAENVFPMVPAGQSTAHAVRLR